MLVWRKLTCSFQAMVERKAADLMISVGAKPCLKISGEITPMDEFGEVTPEDAESVLLEIMPGLPLRQSPCPDAQGHSRHNADTKPVLWVGAFQ